MLSWLADMILNIRPCASPISSSTCGYIVKVLHILAFANFVDHSLFAVELCALDCVRYALNITLLVNLHRIFIPGCIIYFLTLYFRNLACVPGLYLLPFPVEFIGGRAAAIDLGLGQLAE